MAGGAEYKYNMVENPGSLVDVDANAAGTFRSGKYNVNVLDENTVYYRAGDSTKSPLGQYYTAEPPRILEQQVIKGAYIGGKEQIFVPKPWNIDGVKVISSIPLK